ncbi:MAG: nucleotide exchange factor GrpE [Clostridia bacterium]|nr:nucleotide exchange factor GrpE [Clostridia bacterium]
MDQEQKKTAEDTENAEMPAEETVESPKEDIPTEEAEEEAKARKKELKKAEKCAKELEELKDKYVRVCAEYDNYRKRTDKEKGDSYSAGIAYSVKMLLPVLDNLDRALAFDPENEGVKMIIKQINESFAKLGVEEIESDGKKFDPEFHNAVMHEEDPEKEESVVVQTFQKGYMLAGKVLRHAMVKVAN